MNFELLLNSYNYKEFPFNKFLDKWVDEQFKNGEIKLSFQDGNRAVRFNGKLIQGFVDDINFFRFETPIGPIRPSKKNIYRIMKYMFDYAEINKNQQLNDYLNGVK